MFRYFNISIFKFIYIETYYIFIYPNGDYFVWDIFLQTGFLFVQCCFITFAFQIFQKRGSLKVTKVLFFMVCTYFASLKNETRSDVRNDSSHVFDRQELGG